MNEVYKHITSFAHNLTDLRPNLKPKGISDGPPCGPPREAKIF